MEYHIEIDTANGVIFASALGAWQSDIDDRMVTEIFQAVKEHNVRNVLLDIRELRFDLSTVRIFQRAKEMRDMRLQKREVSSKVALVYSAGDSKLEADMKFFETAAQNRAAPYRIFTDVEAARKWLMQV